MKTSPPTLRNGSGLNTLWFLLLLATCCFLTEQATAETLNEIWKIPVGTGNIENNNNTRQLTFNPVSGNVIYVSRGTPALAVNRARGSDGAVLSTMNITGISGGTIALSSISAAEDGAIYACNVVAPNISSTAPLKVYRWANESATPTLIYSGDISGNATGRWGDSLTARGSGATTQIIIGSDQTAFGLLKTSDGTTFTGAKVTVASGTANAYRTTFAFRGALGNFWTKTSGATGRYVSIDTAAGTATDLGALTLTDSTSVAGLAYYAPKAYLAAVKRTGSTTPANGKVYLYDAASSQTAPVLLATASYSTATTDTAGQSSGAFGVVNGDIMLFSLVINNGIAGYKVTPAPTLTDPVAQTVNAGDTATFSVTATGPGPLTYQWQKNSQNITDGATGTGSTIAGATTSTLTITSANTNDLGNYRVVVTGPGGSVTSPAASLTVNQLTQVVSFDALPDKTYGDAPFQVTASSDSGLPVTLTVLSGPVTISGTTATIVAAGPVTIRAAQPGNGYYVPAFVDRSFNVAPITVIPSVVVANKIYDGTTLAPITSRSLTGVLPGDDATLGTSGVANFDDKNIGTAKPVTITGLALSGASAGGYVLSTTTLAASADITARSLTVSATGINKTYDGTTAATVTLSHDGPVGDALTLSYTSAVFADKEVGTGKTVSVTGISVSGADLGNYTAANTTATTTAAITPATLAVIGIEALDKTYDGTTNATLVLSDAVLVGVLNGEDVTMDTNNATGGFADKIVETNKTVTVYGLTLVGADIAHYTLPNPTTNADITPRSLTFTAAGQNKTYDGTPAAVVSFQDDRLEGDTLSFTYTATFPDKAAGLARAITVTDIALTGADATNYTLATTSAATAADIAPAPVIITGVTAVSRVYDGSLAAALAGTPALSGTVVGDEVSLAGTPVAAFETKSAGLARPVNVSGFTLAGVDAFNYTLSALVLSANITPAALTASGLTAQDKVYDGTPVATITGAPALVGVLGTDDVGVTGTAAGAFDTKAVGADKAVAVSGLSLTGLDAANYSLAEPVLHAAITPAGLTITGLTAQNKTYDGTLVATLSGTAALAGVMGSDEVTLAGTAAGAFADKAVGTGKAVHVTGLTLSGGDAANYTLGALALSADITARTLVITAAGVNKAYDGTTTATVTLSHDGIAGDALTLAYTSAEFADKEVGNAKAVAVSGISVSGADAGNYTGANTTAAATANITPAALTVVGIEAVDKVYDGTTVAELIVTNAVLVGVLGTEEVGLETNNAVGAFADKAVGTDKTVTVSGLVLAGADMAHYSLTAPTTNADITVRTLTVTATGQNKVYDGTVAATVSVADDRVAGDVLTVGVGLATFENKNAGLAKAVSVTGITVTGADAANYTFNTSAATTADITPAPVSVTGLTAVPKVYDATLAAALSGTPALSGTVVGDEVSLAGTPVAVFETKNAGLAKPVNVSGLTLAGADAVNYTLSALVLSANITPAALAVSGLTAQDKVYDGTPAATITGAPALVGVLGTDDVGVTGTAAGAFDTKAVGTDKAVAVSGLSLTGLDAANYSLAEPVLHAAITPAGLTITGLTAQNKTYDGTLVATLSGTAALAGVMGSDEVTLAGTAAGAFADKAVGTGKAVHVTGLTLSGGDAANYTLGALALSADITARTLVITATGVNKVYDGTTSATVNLTDDRVAGDNLTLGYSAATFADKNVGTARTVSVTGITASGADAGNYSHSSTASTAADITKAPLTVTAENATRVYSAPNPSFTATYSGFVSGETADVVLGAPEFATAATVSSPAGDYPITPSLGTLVAANYSFESFVEGTLKITAADTTASLAPSENPSWQGSNVTFTATIAVVAPATQTPGGEVVFLANGVAFSTNALVAGVASASTTSLPAGTNEVKVEYTGSAEFAGSTNTLLQVVNVPITYSETNIVLAIEDKRDGSFELTFQGTPGAQYYVVSHSVPVAPPSEWTIIAGSTNTVSESSGIWHYTVTADGPYRFYRSVAVNPAP